MQSKFTRLFQDPVRQLTTRTLWDGVKKGLDLKTYYPVHQAQKLVVHSHGFDSSTLRGVGLTTGRLEMVPFLINAARSDFLYRGLSRAEFKDAVNTRLNGLVGRKPLVIRDKEGIIDTTLTKANLDKHQNGDIHGISTTTSAGTAFGFSGLMSVASAIMLIDTQNVPSEHQHRQIYDPNLTPLNSQGEPANYSHEVEVTMSGVHISAVLGRATRQGLTIHFEWNPLYVDKLLLSSEFKAEYEHLLSIFYDASFDARKSPDENKIVTYLELQKTFYQELSHTRLIDPVRKDRIDSMLLAEAENNHEHKPRK